MCEMSNIKLLVLDEASYFDRINMTEKRLEFDHKKSHRQTVTLQHDQKFTPTNINLWTWPEYGWIWPKLKNMNYILGQVGRIMIVGVNFSVMFKIFGHIHSVILNRSSEHSSFQAKFSKKFNLTIIYFSICITK